MLSFLEASDTSIDDVGAHLKKMVEIGIALSAEKNIDTLFDMIVEEARALAMADSGTLYILDRDRNVLSFKILQNNSLGLHLKRTENAEILLPDVDLYHGESPNYENASSFAALQGKILNIPDVYASTTFDFTGPMKYDSVTGYRSQSMLVIPMKNHENEVIGVLQLLNAQEVESGRVVPFGDRCVSLVEALASQAAVALTNRQLIQEIKKLFYSFIETIAGAIDEKSPNTGDHIKRVVKITMALAMAVNESNQGLFKEHFFDDEEMEELRLSAWMHDVGKITTPEYVMDKSTRLESKFDRIHLIETRFSLIAEIVEKQYLEKQVKLLQSRETSSDIFLELEKARKENLSSIHEDLAFIKTCHRAEFVNDKMIHRLNKIAEKQYIVSGKIQPFLDPWELENLSIQKGSLNETERHIIENHATMTLKMLSCLPFPKNLSRVTDFAASHHERLNGTGYPRKLKGDALPLQARIIAIADIFEALSARDRPYRKRMEISHIFEIMGKMKENGHIDPDLFDLFVRSDIGKKVKL
ncbi:putative 3',5'-cyclic-nucleotide phosphodiesterase [Desulforapulum autotrophicum HRM2]|uniref:3',5'-cyclic-nucleotide phosphodiesterase n=1 Tax=Desulforapulum autotrophicum (strain ATCC 43914 / DSM 3382 / VKM B-1955 / HRM2) TaxID=177437 RepID=C0QCF5_DESAH|nr:HD family phosphohydrolase [Desulforapulum autotrophicum]ACN17172.1 putative 3',5'-cyclic-nucleotide phosphodiesterase [Desulforapulum autotrophicum HRM2]